MAADAEPPRATSAGLRLDGRRVVVTRSEAQSADLCGRLRALGAVPIAFPVIRIEPLAAPELEGPAPTILRGVDWIVLTSVNAVEQLFDRVAVGVALGAGVAKPRIAAVGEATAHALEERGVRADVVPDEFRGRALVEGLGALRDRVVLLPRSRIGRPEIAAELRARGAQVRELALYDTVRVSPRPEALAELERGFDAVTFTSPSSVRNFLAILERSGRGRGPLEGAVVACIGPVTAEEARARGLTPDVVPDSYTVSDLVAALAERFAGSVETGRPGVPRARGGRA